MHVLLAVIPSLSSLRFTPTHASQRHCVFARSVRWRVLVLMSLLLCVCCCCAAPACRLPVWLAGVAGCWLKAHTIVSLWLAGASLFFVLCCEPVQTVVFGQSPFLGSVLGFANCQFRFLLSFSVALLFLRSIKRSSPSCIDCSCVLCVGVLLARS